MSYTLTFTIPELPELPNRLQRRHWSAIRGHAVKWHWLVRQAVGQDAPPEPLSFARVRMVRHSAQEPDRDNLWASWKPVLDSLRYAGVILDDKPQHCDFDGSGWVQAPRRKGYVAVSVEEVDPLPPAA